MVAESGCRGGQGPATTCVAVVVTLCEPTDALRVVLGGGERVGPCPPRHPLSATTVSLSFGRIR